MSLTAFPRPPKSRPLRVMVWLVAGMLAVAALGLILSTVPDEAGVQIRVVAD